MRMMAQTDCTLVMCLEQMLQLAGCHTEAVDVPILPLVKHEVGGWEIV